MAGLAMPSHSARDGIHTEREAIEVLELMLRPMLRVSVE